MTNPYESGPWPQPIPRRQFTNAQVLALIATIVAVGAVIVVTMIVIAVKLSSSSSAAADASPSSGDIYNGFTPNPNSVEYTIGKNGGFFIKMGHGGQPLSKQDATMSCSQQLGHDVGSVTDADWLAGCIARASTAG